MAKRPHITEATKKNLMDAFWKLYLTKPIDKISVREITDIAGYNRGTFYLYFKDVYNVLENIEKEMLDFIENESLKYKGAFDEDISKNDLSAVIATAIEIFAHCEFKPFVLLSDHGDPAFEQAIRKKMQTTLEYGMAENTQLDNVTKEYIIHFVVSGVLGIIRKWYDDGMKIPVEEHISTVCKVLFGSKYIINNKLCKET